MSIKTIAVDVKTYEELSREKRTSESYTKTIDRLLKDARSKYTCGHAYEEVSALVDKPLSDEETKVMESAIRDNRRHIAWDKPSWS
jgi:predicted CopG family antitoxin